MTAICESEPTLPVPEYESTTPFKRSGRRNVDQWTCRGTKIDVCLVNKKLKFESGSFYLFEFGLRVKDLFYNITESNTKRWAKDKKFQERDKFFALVDKHKQEYPQFFFVSQKNEHDCIRFEHLEKFLTDVEHSDIEDERVYQIVTSMLRGGVPSLIVNVVEGIHKKTVKESIKRMRSAVDDMIQMITTKNNVIEFDHAEWVEENESEFTKMCDDLSAAEFNINQLFNSTKRLRSE